MTNWKKAKLYTFLTERGVRVKAARVPELGLQRVDKIDFNGRIHLSERPTNTDMILVKPGDLLISGINAAKGAVAVYEGEADVLASIHYSSYRLDRNLIDVDYLRAFLRSAAFEKILRASTNGGIKTELRAKHLLPLEIELPPLAEQTAIARTVETHQKEITEVGAELARQATLLIRLRQAVLREAVKGHLVPQHATDEPAPALLARIRAEKQRLVREKKLRPEKPLPPLSEAEVPYEVPDGWAWCRLGDCIVSAKDGPHFSPQYASKGIPFLSMRNISTSGIDFSSAKFISKEYHEEISKRCKPVKGDILYTKGGTTGIACVNDTDIDFNVWVHVAVLRLTPDIYPFYLRDCLNSPFCYDQSQTLTKGIGNRDLGLQRMVTIPIPLPPLSEQRRIVAKVTELLAHCTALEAELQQAQHAAEALHAAALREAFAPVPVEAVG